MDFDRAVATHSKWKRSLREYVDRNDGTLLPDEVAVDHECELGQWIYGEGASYSTLPEFMQLKYAHTIFHRVAADLVRRANAGEPVAEEVAPCSSSEFSTASSAVVMALMSMKKVVTN